MSTYSINSNPGSVTGVSGSGAITPPVLDQGRALEEALGVVKVQSYHMRRCLNTNKLMDALKHASTMLAELRTSVLTPKYYYELYMAIFDEIRHLSTYLYETHVSGRHHLSDLYELVQYAANIIPRLYLMITVGAVYMRVSRETFSIVDKPSDSGGDKENVSPNDPSLTETVQEKKPEEQDIPPIKELMRDMLDMTRGVQHPTRGLFLRYYLSGLTRDFLPDGSDQHVSPHGGIDDSIHFVLQNFIEMNKLWVRLQHQGHSRDREKREIERKELRLLVGSNLVRLSQLEDLSLAMYQGNIMPQLLEEIVSCRDVIAQEYLMEVVIQVFPDDFHLRCLDMFLSATARLQRTVNVKQIVISLIDRFSGYAARAREEATGAKDAQTISGIPDDVKLFDVFWTQITELIKARPEFTLQDTIALLVSLANLSLNCYPDELGHIDKVLGIAKTKVQEALLVDELTLTDSKTKSLLLQLLLGPVQTYNSNVLRILDFPSSSTHDSEDASDASSSGVCLGGNYTKLLFLQPYGIRRQVAHAFATHALRAAVHDDFKITTIEGVNFILGEIGTIMVRDQIDGGLFGAKPKPHGQLSGPSSVVSRVDESRYASNEPDIPLDWEDAREEQTYLAKLIHTFRADDNSLDQEYKLLVVARNHFGEGGDIRIRFTLPPLVTCLIKLARKCYYAPWNATLAAESMALTGHATNPRDLVPQILKTIHETITSLSRAQEHFSDDDGYKPLFKDDYGSASSTIPRIGHGLMSPPDVSLRLHLLAAQVSDSMHQEEMCYEFFVQALVVYEESVSESKAQVNAITQIMGTLYGTTVFGYENYETLITKCAVHCSRLLRRVDQCRGVVLLSHLFWADAGQVDTVLNGSSSALLSTVTSSTSGPIRTKCQKREEGKPAYRDARRVLECLQKALKIADSVMDPSVNVELFVEILERYIWFFSDRNEAVSVKYISSLVDLIQTNLGACNGAEDEEDTDLNGRLSTNTGGIGGPLNTSKPPVSIFRERSKKVSQQTATHFKNVLAYLRFKRDIERDGLDSGLVVPGMSSGFAGGEVGGGRWGSIEIPRV